VSVDVNVLIGTISGLINSAANREGWVKSVMEAAAYAGGYRYNVMVFNLNTGYTYSFGDIVFYKTFTYAGMSIGVWVFGLGGFTNHGDGGYNNWAFTGNFVRATVPDGSM
jgi:hypothetical protein